MIVTLLLSHDVIFVVVFLPCLLSGESQSYRSSVSNKSCQVLLSLNCYRRGAFFFQRNTFSCLALSHKSFLIGLCQAGKYSQKPCIVSRLLLKLTLTFYQKMSLNLLLNVQLEEINIGHKVHDIV